MSLRASHLPPVWLLLWFCLALLAIFQHGPMPLYSTRTLAVAWEMWNTGQWLVPHINGQPYSHKVPLLFWLIHAGWAVFGVNDIWPSVLQIGIGAGWLAASAALARRVLDLRPAAAASVPWLLGALVYPFLFGLQIMYETLLALTVVLALWAMHGRPRWGWFALALGAGLMTKGPVMLLHVAFPLLLGPWWSEYARADPWCWYRRGALGVAAGLAVLLAWAVPAGMAGGEAYRNELFFLQTAGRVVDSFDHARPLHWYLPMLLVLLFPWVAWPRLWRAVFAQRPQLDDSSRFLASWLLPTFVVFCLISGKQVYYLLPLLPAACIAIALVLARAQPAGTGRRRWSAWPLALLLFAVALALVALSLGLLDAQRGPRWLGDVAAVGGWFAPGLIALGAVLLVWAHGRHEIARIASVTLGAAVLMQMLFAQSMYRNFDLRPAAARIALAQTAGRPVANVGGYAGQFHFFGRLARPIDDIHTHDLPAWTQQHPHGMIVRYPVRSDPHARDRAEWMQPFRSRQLEIWDATVLAEFERASAPSQDDEDVER
ncbi:4-amino-4-deoxy-L-arabinose transferase-like glycosyltransferase [Tahibacter aquaticus]|uniref:4-amino-4-deoxy-L-arabinose transferase-like glycosyltransferase n=1 Tax=Tahibacter aquaticus TaxID=520092 RepID=A0A4R6Z278_9GAMM|nr:glycosyl transferase [Tahibacter aquaticus]TDR45680.1 4-amino-4-deoxy-L-arabinose transferase-like glycosyltransferase [Tahibacter aquaticus]